MRIALLRIILATLLTGWAVLPLTTPARAEAAPGAGPVEGDATETDKTEEAVKETIVIRADRAWEEPDGGQVLHFAGSFELISPDWELRSEEADLYGPLDDPTRIVARGAPAYLLILDGEGNIEGEGAVIEYQRDADVLVLTENAHLKGDDISLSSSEIVFDVTAERLRSSGTDGVEMVLERAK
jgi:lipopolysaccharide transport protein LptA